MARDSRRDGGPFRTPLTLTFDEAQQLLEENKRLKSEAQRNRDIKFSVYVGSGIGALILGMIIMGYFTPPVPASSGCGSTGAGGGMKDESIHDAGTSVLPLQDEGMLCEQRLEEVRLVREVVTCGPSSFTDWNQPPGTSRGCWPSTFSTTWQRASVLSYSQQSTFGLEPWALHEASPRRPILVPVQTSW